MWWLTCFTLRPIVRLTTDYKAKTPILRTLRVPQVCAQLSCWSVALQRSQSTASISFLGDCSNPVSCSPICDFGSLLHLMNEETNLPKSPQHPRVYVTHAKSHAESEGDASLRLPVLLSSHLSENSLGRCVLRMPRLCPGRTIAPAPCFQRLSAHSHQDAVTGRLSVYYQASRQ